ncbi:uncharacterized protein BXZ73DRAFT_78962 [Epithele typhae]|uniref:uncharacterized protein n=1 Tax=Epithele typhae TaxID=378194 RepID=UPI002008C81F|nr:uncharacterized protein BXZ73DRAFT_78962 [Epithele typhae]KAH9925623.1 hypothetical protein BXZ73DRAFT_78962 [Epithele typhae]
MPDVAPGAACSKTTIAQSWHSPTDIKLKGPFPRCCKSRSPPHLLRDQAAASVLQSIASGRRAGSTRQAHLTDRTRARGQRRASNVGIDLEQVFYVPRATLNALPPPVQLRIRSFHITSDYYKHMDVIRRLSRALAALPNLAHVSITLPAYPTASAWKVTRSHTRREVTIIATFNELRRGASLTCSRAYVTRAAALFGGAGGSMREWKWGWIKRVTKGGQVGAVEI